MHNQIHQLAELSNGQIVRKWRLHCNKKTINSNRLLALEEEREEHVTSAVALECAVMVNVRGKLLPLLEVMLMIGKLSNHLQAVDV